MSPSPAEPPPHTPDRRSSSNTLLDAFRSLTGGRRSSTPPQPAEAPAVSSSARRPSISLLSRSASIATSAPAVPGSTTQASPLSGLHGARAIVGGPPELDDLVPQLNSSHTLTDRALAVDSISAVLDDYPLRNVLALWTSASDLLGPHASDESATVGYKLLKSCVSLPDLSPVERSVFFDAILLRYGDNHFDTRLQIVSTLTNDGRTIEACESAVAPFILSAVEPAFIESREAFHAVRKSHGKKTVDKPIKEAETMAQLFQFSINICKFNSKAFNEDQLALLLKKAMDICQETTQERDIQNAIRLFDTVVTYAHVPSQALKPSLEVMCTIYRQLESLQEQTWNTLANLFKSHLGQAAVSALLRTLLEGPDRPSRRYSIFRGAIQVLQLLLMEDGHAGLPKVPLSLLFPALKASIQVENCTQEKYVVGLVAAIMSEERMRNLLLKEADWSDLTDIIRICVEREEEREENARNNIVEDETTEKPTLIASNLAFKGLQALRNCTRNAVNKLIGSFSGLTSTTPTPGEPDTDAASNADSNVTPPTKSTNIRKTPDEKISSILIGLDAISHGMDLVQRAALMELFMKLAPRLSDSTAENMIRFYSEQRYLHPSNPDWLNACHNLVSSILNDSLRPRSLRILCISVLRDTYNTVEGLCSADIVSQCAAFLLNNIEAEEDVDVLSEYVGFAVEVADQAYIEDFQDIVALLTKRLDRQKLSAPASAAASPAWNLSAFANRSEQVCGSVCNVIATAFVRLFIRSVIKSAQKTRILYEVLRNIAGEDAYSTDARLTALKLLFRLRADSGHALIVSSSSEGESIAAVLCRTAETAMSSDRVDDNGSIDSNRHDEQQPSWRDQRKVSGSSPRSSLNRHASRQKLINGRVPKPVPPLWMYPGPKGLPEEPSTQASRVVFSHKDPSEYPLSDDIHDMEITLWLELIVSLLQKPTDWEIYSYVLVHLGPQLSNQALVRSCVSQLQFLRNVICEQLRNSSFREPPAHTLLKKSDLAVCLFHGLTILISYHEYFSKSEEDDLVKTLIHGLGWGDRTSKWCVHALTVCCQEMPLSVSKSLDSVIQKMSQIITKPSTAVHILEFLTSVARMPQLYKNFREDEYKMVFGVSFRYLQHVRDEQERRGGRQTPATLDTGGNRVRYGGLSREPPNSSDPQLTRKSRPAIDDLPQYVYSLAYHVITFWFMGLRIQDRPKQIPWITKSLQYTDSTGRLVMEEQGQVIVDMMNMVAYTDRDETRRDPDFANTADGEIWSKTWILGTSLLTIETAARTGVSQITTRRPSGTRFLYLKPLLAPPPRHQIPVPNGQESDAFNTPTYVGILPGDIFQTYYAAVNLVEPAIPLPDDDMTSRAITAVDRTSAIDTHKVGVIYIGDGQKNEREILMNDVGSAAFNYFISGLGTLVRLKDANFNTGGLDTHNNQDGEFTICWRDRCIEVIFHIPTMMPTNPDDDMTYPNKKAHIGNDFVNIIFNDSGLPYNFDTFPSAFNYVHIVITPESRASFVDRRLDTDVEGAKRYYKVQVICRPDFPEISPAVEPKILAGEHLAAYCRLIAINASVFSQVWFIREGGESVSSWRSRLREIKRMRERYGGTTNDMSSISSPSSPVNTQQNLSSPPPKEVIGAASGFKRTSVATYISEGGRSSITSGSHDHVRE